MKNLEKICLWTFGLMFAIPEIIFFNIISFPVYFLRGEVLNLFPVVFNNYYLDITYFLIVLMIEIIGAFGLFILSIKNNKKIFAVAMVIISIWLFFIFCFIKVFSAMNF
jgi:hypothetical protein